MITCSINNPEIVSLLYSHITAQFKISSKEGVFNYEDYLKNLYKKISETTSPEVAAKYLQSVPRLIIDVANTNLSFMNIDVDLTSLRKLSVQYMSDNAINIIIDTLSDKKINLKDIINRIKSNEIEEEEEDDENEIPEPSSKSKRLLTASPLSGTLQTLKSQDPNKKLIIEEDDPGKAHIVKALENISASQNMEEDLYTVMYQGKKIYFKPFVLNDFFTKNKNLLDSTTITEVNDSRYLSTKEISKKNVVQANEKIILVITDENGKFLYFDKDGNLAETGKIVYQFMRNASIENNKIVVKDFYGKAITIQSAETIFKNTYDPEINGSTAEDKALFLKEIKDTLKKESEQLLDLQNRIIKNKEDFLLPITNISTGITEDKISDTYKLNALIDSKLLNKDSLKTIDATSKIATISFKNEKVVIDRMKMSDELVRKISKVLTNKNLKNKVKLNFVKQFLFLNSTGKRNFSIKEDGPNLIFNILDKNSQEIVEELNLSEVTEDNIENYETKIKDTFFNQIPYLFYNNEIIKGNHVYNDYNTETKEIVQADYLDLIISLNPDIKFINISNDIFNFVVNFSAEDVSFDNLKESVESNEVESELSYDYFLEKARKAITEGFATNSQGYSLSNSLSFVMFNFIKNDLDNGKFSTQEQFTKIINEWTEMSSYDGNPTAITDKQKNLIRDKFNALPKEKVEAKEVKETTSKTDVIQNTIVPGAASPTDTDTGIDINDPIFKGLDRKGFKKEKITQEQLEDINTWWNSKALEPLRKVISFKQVFNLVNSDVYATFIVNASKIANPDGSLATIAVNRKQGDIFQNLTLYHEAWHIFSQLFLTPQDKIKLYTELRNYTDSKGNKPNINKSYLELEEMLAEDFRNYAKNQKPNPETPVKNTLFRKMLNFLKALFGKLNVFSKKDILVDSMNSPMAKDLFNKLYIGEINSYKPLIENAVLFELDRGIRKVNNPSKDILSNQDSLEVTMTIDNIWAELLSDIYNKRKAAGKQNLKAANVLFLKGVEQKEYLYRETKKILEDKLKKEQEKFNKIEDVTEDYTELITDSISETVLSPEQSVILDNIRILQTTLDNWGSKGSGVIKYHSENSDFKTSKKVYDIAVDAKEEVEKEEGVDELTIDAVPGKISLQDMLSKETIYVIKSLFKVVKNKNGDISTPVDRFGFKERADFSDIFNMLYGIIGNISNRDEAYKKLEKEYKKYPELKQFFEEKYPEPNTTNTFEYDLSVSFFNDFGKPNVKYVQLVASRDETVNFQVIELSMETSSIIEKWVSEFNSLSIYNDFIDVIANVPRLNLDKVVNEFKQVKENELDNNKQLEFANAIGIGLANNNNIKDELKNNSTPYGLKYIFRILNAFNNVDKLPQQTALQKKYIKEFKANPIKILKEEIPKNILPEIDKVNVIKQNTQIKNLAKLQSQYGFDSSTNAVIRADGNVAYETMNASSVTNNLYAINSVSKQDELWNGKNPILNHMNFLDPRINAFTKNLVMFQSLFGIDKVKIKGKNLNLIVIDGTSEMDGSGTITTKLDPFSKFIQDINMMLLNGKAELGRTADKKMSFGLTVKGGLLKPTLSDGTKGTDDNIFVDPIMFTSQENTGEMYAIEGYLLKYIESEFDRIKKFKGPDRDELLKITGYNQIVGKVKGENVYAGEVFAAFDNLLSTKTKNELYKLAVKEDTISTLLELLKQKDNAELKNNIQNEIKKYFNDKVSELKKYYYNPIKEKNIFSKGIYKKLGMEVNNQADLNMLNGNEELSDVLLKAFLYNDWIYKFETSTLLFGDIAQWDHTKEDWTKRIPGGTSDGIRFLFDEGTINFINNNFNKPTETNATYASELNKSLDKDTVDYNKYVFSEVINAGVIKDATRESIYIDDLVEAWREDYLKTFSEAETEERIKEDRKAYEEIVESDGMAFMTIDAYRILHKVSGRGWSMEQESLYQKIVKGETIDPNTVKQFFPIYKLHLFGSIKNKYLPAIAMHKFAVSPLIPGVNAKEGSELYKLHLKMLKDNVQYVTFKSGSKGSELTSNRETDDIFEDKVENTGISDDFTFTINPVYLANLKEVTVINDTFKGSLPIATQTRVILTDSLYNNGELINSKNKKTLDSYSKIVNDYSALLKLKLLNEIGFTKKDGKYVSNGNFSKFIKIIRDNLDERDVPDHLIRLLNTTKEGNDISMDFSLHPEAQTIEKLIMSIVQKRLIKQTINGEPLIQAATTFTNGLWNTQYDRITKISEIKKVLGTNTLPSYIRNKNGRTGLMKVAIALQGDFKNLLNANDLQGNKIGTITRLNELIKDDAWLEKNRLSISLYGPRIPNDALSTIEGAEVWHFLDESYGNAIIVPTEIVAKSGSDYDGDKLFMSMPNIDAEGNYINTPIKNFNKILKETKDKEFAGTLELGALTSNKLIKQQEKYLQNQYIKISLDILTLPENFAILTKPNLTYLVEKYSKALENNIKNEYNRLDNVSYTDSEVGERNKSKDDKEVISPSRNYDYIYNLYKFASNLSLEPSLGIQAKNTKNHVLFKMLGAKMPESYKNSIFNKNLREFEDGLIDIPFVIRFKHNIIKLKNGKEVISISGDKSQKGNRITDLNSHMLNGILDRAKNSFPFVLQLTPEGIGVISYLMQAGVDEEEVFYFVTQPLIREYFFKQRLENSSLNPLISTDAQFEKSNKYNIASEISNKILNTLAPNELQRIINGVTLLKLRDTINSLEKIDSANVEYLIKDNEKQSYYYSLNELKKALNNKKINPLNIVSIKNNNNEDVYDIVKSLENKSIDNKTKTYDFSNNYVYLSEVLSRELFKDGITISDLEESMNNDISLKSLALFLNFIELEKQYEGLETLQMIYAPDTSKLTTLQQVIKRIELFDKLKRNSKIDQEFLTKLMEDSLLSSFNQDALMIDLIKPLFKLRLDKSISSFISEKLLKERARISRKFGKGVKGEEYFTSSYNNAVVDYIYQNYMSNFTDPVNGKHITIPKALSSKDVIIDNTIEQDVIVGKNIIVNEEKLKLDFDNKIFLNDDALDTFEKNKNPFQTFSSYVRYVMEREVLRESLNDVEVTEEYLSEVALLKSFNSPYIMGKTKYSYSESMMNIINNFDDTKVNFPVLNHIVLKSNKRNINKVLTLNNKSLLTKEISSIYNKNLKDLADPTINKDKKSLEFFKPFSLILFYQHGFGNSKLSINRVLDAKKFTDEMIDASTFFINDLISRDFSSVTLNNIFSKVIDVKNRQFIEYTENADQYNNPVKKDIDDGIEIEFDLENKKNIKLSTSVVERTNKIILRSELKANPKTLYLFGDNDIRKGLGGQAKEMRGEPNAIGVSTKKLPARGEEAYKSDAELEKNKKIITNDINKAIAEWNTGKYNKLIIPQMGVGLAELPTRAPETYKFLQQELKRLEDQVTQSSTSVNPAEFTNHSGGAYGGDTFWDLIGREFGVTNHKHYKDAGNANLSQQLKNKGVKAEILTEEQMNFARQKVKELLGITYNDDLRGNLQVRNFYQVYNSDAIYAIAKLNTMNDTVSGGTNTAVQLGIKLEKPVYVWDINTERWYSYERDLEDDLDGGKKWDGFIEWDTPELTKNFAGIGSRDIENYNVQKDGKWVPRAQYKGPEVEAAAKQAIRDVYANTFKATTQPSTSVKEGVEDLFTDKPELSNIGTPQQYSEWIKYLTTQGKLAGTQATNILYHGTYEEFEEFDEEKKGANTGINIYQSEDKSEQFFSDSAHTIFFSDRKTNAISYTLLGRERYLLEISDALKDVRSAQKDLAQDGVQVLKEVPYFNNLINNAKKEGKTTKEIIELLGKEEIKLTKKYKKGSSSLFTNELAGYEVSLKELNKFLFNIDIFKTNLNINFKNSTGNFNIFKKDGRLQFARFDKGRTVITGERFFVDEVDNNKIKEFINDAIAEDKNFYNQAKINMKAAGFEEKTLFVLLNLQNPSIHDYEKSSFTDAYKNTKTRTAAFAAKQVDDALKKGNDGVIYENIVDPLLSNSYGVFETEQIYILGGTEDIKGFKNFVTQTSTSAPIREELEGLTEARKVYESLFIATGKPPITFTVGVSTWKLNKNFNYDLIDQDTGEIYLANVNMVTGIIEEDVVESILLTKEQKNNFIKDFEQKVINYKLDELLSLFNINIQDVYKKINNATTKEDLIEIETEINNKLCQ